MESKRFENLLEELLQNWPAEARRILDHSLLQQMFKEMEIYAVERAVYARPSDDQMRREAMTEIRILRGVQSRLRELAGKEEKGEDSGPSSVA